MSPAYWFIEPNLANTRCAEVFEIKDCSAGELEEKMALRNGLEAVTHRLDFFGVRLPVSDGRATRAIQTASSVCQSSKCRISLILRRS